MPVFEVLGTLLKLMALSQLLWFGLVFIILAVLDWKGKLNNV